MKVNLPKEEIERQKCLIIASYEEDVLNFWKYIKESNFSEEQKQELGNKFKIYGIED